MIHLMKNRKASVVFTSNDIILAHIEKTDTLDHSLKQVK